MCTVCYIPGYTRVWYLWYVHGVLYTRLYTYTRVCYLGYGFKGTGLGCACPKEQRYPGTREKRGNDIPDK